MLSSKSLIPNPANDDSRQILRKFFISSTQKAKESAKQGTAEIYRPESSKSDTPILFTPSFSDSSSKVDKAVRELNKKRLLSFAFTDLFDQCFPGENTYRFDSQAVKDSLPPFLKENPIAADKFLNEVPKLASQSLSAAEIFKLRLLNFFGVPTYISSSSTQFTGWQFCKNMIGWHNKSATPAQRWLNYSLFWIKPVLMLLLNCLTIITRTLSNTIRLITEFLPLVSMSLAKDAATYFHEPPGANQKSIIQRLGGIFKIMVLICFAFFKILQYVFYGFYLSGRMITSPIASLRAAYAFKMFNADQIKNPTLLTIINRAVALTLTLVSLVSSVTCYIIVLPLALKFAVLHLPNAVGIGLTQSMQVLQTWVSGKSIFSVMGSYLLKLGEFTLMPLMQWIGVTLSATQIIVATTTILAIVTAYILENIREALLILLHPKTNQLVLTQQNVTESLNDFKAKAQGLPENSIDESSKQTSAATSNANQQEFRAAVKQNFMSAEFGKSDINHTQELQKNPTDNNDGADKIDNTLTVDVENINIGAQTQKSQDNPVEVLRSSLSNLKRQLSAKSNEDSAASDRVEPPITIDSNPNANFPSINRQGSAIRSTNSNNISKIFERINPNSKNQRREQATESRRPVRLPITRQVSMDYNLNTEHKEYENSGATMKRSSSDGNLPNLKK